MAITFNLDAPIIPGESAAGIHLENDIARILEGAKPDTITPLKKGKRYHFGSVTVWVNNNGKVSQIGLYEGYRGKTVQGIGIGSTLKEVTSTVGTVMEDEEDNLITLELSGWCFETQPWQQQKNNLPDLTAAITEIYVFSDFK